MSCDFTGHSLTIGCACGVDYGATLLSKWRFRLRLFPTGVFRPLPTVDLQAAVPERPNSSSIQPPIHLPPSLARKRILLAAN
ncbi:hypothetical protein K523DRAFT_129771 [Schizophyllum commune Tattone D]|nr:hypothetical protein K523DRAFT_129771 [Schizophyllum commune Tattone D]